MDAPEPDEIDNSTVEGLMLSEMTSACLEPEEAQAILEEYKASKMGQSMQKYWKEQASILPPFFLEITWKGIESQVMPWFEKNKPEEVEIVQMMFGQNSQPPPSPEGPA